MSRITISRDLRLSSIRQRSVALLLGFSYFIAVILLVYMEVDKYVGEQR